MKKGKIDKNLSHTYTVFVQRHLGLFVKGTDLEVFSYICNRTLSFGKYADSMTPANFYRGVPTMGIPGLPHIPRSNKSRHKRNLQDNYKLIFFDTVSTNKSALVEYIVNVPGIYNVLVRLYENVLDDPAFATVGKHLEFLSSSVEDFKKNGWLSDASVNPIERRVMKYKEAVEEGLSKSKEAKARKRKKRKITGYELKPGDIRDTMVECCEEFGTSRYVDFGWTGKDYGCAKNFIKYCKDSRMDARSVLSDVCEYWWRFYDRRLVRDNGKPLLLPESVSFQKFFLYRAEIMVWIEANRGSEIVVRKDAKVITLDYRNKKAKL